MKGERWDTGNSLMHWIKHSGDGMRGFKVNKWWKNCYQRITRRKMKIEIKKEIGGEI